MLLQRMCLHVAFFCVHFGHKEKIDAKCNCTTNVMYFKMFPANMYTRHIAACWKDYFQLRDIEMANFFNTNAPIVHCNTIQLYFSDSYVPRHL